MEWLADALYKQTMRLNGLVEARPLAAAVFSATYVAEKNGLIFSASKVFLLYLLHQVFAGYPHLYFVFFICYSIL